MDRTVPGEQKGPAPPETQPETSGDKPVGHGRNGAGSLSIPFDSGRREWALWEALHNRLRLAEQLSAGEAEWYGQETGAALLEELNSLVSDALGLDRLAQAAISGLVHVRQTLVDGHQAGDAAVRPPERKELRAYGLMLQEELDEFLGEDIPARHRLTIIHI
jgi:hypothetical protein